MHKRENSIGPKGIKSVANGIAKCAQLTSLTLDLV